MAKHEVQQGGWKHTFYGTNNGEWLVGEGSDDTIYANGGDDSADGVGGTDIIDGGDGADSINGGTGSDDLTGGLGGDLFKLDHNGGWDIIRDFHPEQGDRLLVQDDGQYTVVVDDGDTYLNFGEGNGFVLEGYTGFSSNYISFY